MNQQVIETRLRRLYGPSPERREEMRKFLLGKTDWYSRCHRCGEEVSGSIADMLKHRCSK